MLFFVVISLLGSVISQNHFPGEDYLKHGFDALTMQPTTGVIFDTSNSASSLVTFNGKKYKLSNYLSVTTIDTFYEYYNQNVHSTYDSYWRDYTSSYHFSAGPVAIGDLTISANYDKTLHDVQNITSTSDSVISISRGYWFQAAVGFSTVIDSVPKAQSFKDAWKNVPINPITDADYVKYCNLFDAYGQFYHSKLIIGGRFVINTIVSSEYLSKTSASTVSEQMSINARYTVAKMSANTDESEYEQQLSEEFKSSSYTDVYWLPYPPSGTWANESEAIDEWKEYAYANPGVTNSTLNPICDLLRTDNELYPWADTCKELSDYLLTNGKCKRLSLEIPFSLPTSSMNNKEPQPKSSSPHILAPGLDTVGALYDITTMTIGPVVVNQSTPGPWIPFCLPAYPEYCYIFPPYYYPVDSSSANVMNSSFITTRTVDFYTQTSYTTTDDSDGILGFGSKSSSTTTTKLDTFLYQQTYELNVLMRQFHWLNVQLITFPPPPFTDVFQANYNNLRMKGQTYDAWKEIFQQLGTHLIIGAEMGGVVMALEFYQTCLLEKHSTEWIQTQITKKYDPLGVFSSNEVTSTTTATVEKDYEVNSVASFSKHGGSDDIPVEEWDKWQYTVKDRPLPIHLTLIPLCLFVPADLKQSCDASLHEYRQTAENQREADISYMEKLRPSPPTTC